MRRLSARNKPKPKSLNRPTYDVNTMISSRFAQNFRMFANRNVVSRSATRSAMSRKLSLQVRAEVPAKVKPCF